MINREKISEKIYNFKEKASEKISNLIERIKEDKRFFGIGVVVVILILVGVGSFTGHMIMTGKNVENDLAVSQAELKTCQKNLEEDANTLTELSEQVSALEETVSLSAADLNVCVGEKENYNVLLEECTKLKNQSFAELASCRKGLVNFINDLKEQEGEYKKLSGDYKDIEMNFAKSECCPNYDYYTVTDENNILCCYKNGNTYICGAGEEKDEAEGLTCSS